MTQTLNLMSNNLWFIIGLFTDVYTYKESFIQKVL